MRMRDQDKDPNKELRKRWYAIIGYPKIDQDYREKVRRKKYRRFIVRKPRPKY